MYAFNPLKGIAIMLAAFIAVDYFLLGGNLTLSALRAIGFAH